MFAVGVWQCKNDKELRERAKEIMAKYQAEKKVRRLLFSFLFSSKKSEQHCAKSAFVQYIRFRPFDPFRHAAYYHCTPVVRTKPLEIESELGSCTVEY